MSLALYTTQATVIVSVLCDARLILKELFYVPATCRFFFLVCTFYDQSVAIITGAFTFYRT